ncbi:MULTISPECIES: hypothetical protein [Listeria]|uniref:hypothetical protein n=1 Tax=Listeria TaxID=1637 RepID=UPI000B595B4C|nr:MULTISPECIES: hypothetical protein [Listeria]
MSPRGKFYMYAVVNAAPFLPYLLFILVGNEYEGWLNGYAALIIFYVFNYTGTFLFNAFGRRMNAKQHLLLLLCMGIFGSLIATLAPFATFWIEIGAIFIGISSSMILPLYITLQYHERFFYGRKMSNKNYLAALSVLLVAICAAIFLVKFTFPWVAFLFYALLLVVTFYFVYKLPNYEVGRIEKTGFLMRPFIIFLVFSAIIFVIKGVRTTDLASLVTLAVLACLVGIIILTVTLIRFRPVLKLSVLVHYFSLGQGMAVSFALLYGTFYSLAEQNFNYMMFRIYLVYFFGIIFSLLFEPLFKKFWKKRPILELYAIGIAIGVVCMVFPWTISIGVFIIGMFSSMTGRFLNRQAYSHSSDAMKDASLLLRSRWNKLGSIAHQITLVFLLFLGSLFSEKLTITNVVYALGGKGNFEHAFLPDLLFAAGVIALAIMSYWFIGIKKYVKSVKK